MKRRTPSKQVTAIQHRIKARHILISRETLDGFDVASFSRSTGLPMPEIEALVDEERLRRSARA